MTPKYEQEAPLTTGQLYRPAEMYTPWKAVIVPLAQSFTAACIVMAVPGAGRLVYLYPEEWWSWTLLTGACVMLPQYLSGIGFWAWVIRNAEIITHADINNDGVIEEQPSPRIVKVQVDETHGSFMQSNTAEFVDDPRLEILASGLMAGRKFTEDEWVGRQADGKFSATEFKDLREKMLKLRWIKLRNPSDVTRGYILSASGKSVMAQLAPSPVDGLDNSWVRR